jgi:hypothetical protein
MHLDSAELDRRTRETLIRLLTFGPSVSLGVASDLVDLGYDAVTAWLLVESTLEQRTLPAR